MKKEKRTNTCGGIMEIGIYWLAANVMLLYRGNIAKLYGFGYRLNR